MKKVLVVEDDIIIRATLADGLRTSFEVFEAENVQEGLCIAQRDEPDLIMFDPVRDGFEMINNLWAKKEGRKMQAVILTNSCDLGKIAQAMEKGIFTYFVKSDVNMDDLVNRVKQILLQS